MTGRDKSGCIANSARWISLGMVDTYCSLNSSFVSVSSGDYSDLHAGDHSDTLFTLCVSLYRHRSAGHQSRTLCPVPSYSALSCPVLPCSAPSCPVPSGPALFRLISSCHARPVPFRITLFTSDVPYLTVPYLTVCMCVPAAPRSLSRSI